MVQLVAEYDKALPKKQGDWLEMSAQEAEKLAAEQEADRKVAEEATQARLAEEARIREEEEKKKYDFVEVTKRDWNPTRMDQIFKEIDGSVYLFHFNAKVLTEHTGQIIHSYTVDDVTTEVKSVDDFAIDSMNHDVRLKLYKATEAEEPYTEALSRLRDAIKLKGLVGKLLSKNTNLRMAQIEDAVVENAICTPNLELVRDVYILISNSPLASTTPCIVALQSVGGENVKTNTSVLQLIKDKTSTAYVAAAITITMEKNTREYLGELKGLLGIKESNESVAAIDLDDEVYKKVLQEEEERAEAEREEKERQERERQERLENERKEREEAEDRRRELLRQTPAVAPATTIHTSTVIRRPGANDDRKFEKNWVLWHTPKADGWVPAKPLITVSDANKFWAVCNQLPPAGKLADRCSYAWFRENIEPKWEDDANKNGGQWVSHIIPEAVDDVWSELIVKCVGENFQRHQDSVCGVMVELKYMWRISVWLSDNHTTVRDPIGAELETIMRGKLDKQNTEIAFHNNADIKLHGGKVWFLF